MRLERERIFARTWQYVGRAAQVAKPGDFFASRTGHIPVVVLRDEEEVLRGYVNVCRHRGHEVASGEGNRRTLQCPYHAWTYGLDGCLRHAPRADREPGFPWDELSLAGRPGRVRGGRSSSSTPTSTARRWPRCSASCPTIVAEQRRRARCARVPREARLDAGGELEGRDRELPRVLPLPGRPSRVQRDDRRRRRQLPYSTQR